MSFAAIRATPREYPKATFSTRVLCGLVADCLSAAFVLSGLWLTFVR